MKKDTDKAVKLFHRAAELGYAEAYSYDTGNGVNLDTTKARQCYEKSAMAGGVTARFNLGNCEYIAGSFDRAIKHWLIAASFGDIRAVNNIRDFLRAGRATKDQYAQALRHYHIFGRSQN